MSTYANLTVMEVEEVAPQEGYLATSDASHFSLGEMQREEVFVIKGSLKISP